jgi:hypothetical protein
MIQSVRPEADLLRTNADLLNGTTLCADALLYLPFQQWVQTPDCQAMTIARELARTNVQFQVVCEDDLAARLANNPPPILILQSLAVLDESRQSAVQAYQARGGSVVLSDQKDWLDRFRTADKHPAVVIDNAPNVRAVVRTKAGKTIVHVLNLNVQRISSFEDRVTPVASLGIHIRCLYIPKQITALSSNPDATQGRVPFTVSPDANNPTVTIHLPRLNVSTILLIK